MDLHRAERLSISEGPFPAEVVPPPDSEECSISALSTDLACAQLRELTPKEMPVLPTLLTPSICK